MKYLVFGVLLIISNLSIAQDEDISFATDTTCSCLNEVIINHKDKIDFEKKMSNCLQNYFELVKKINPSIDTKIEYNQLIQTNLKKECSSFNTIDSLHNEYTKVSTDFIVKTEECEKIKKGKFITVGDLDSTIIIMNDTIQTLIFSDGTQTKSKIVWLGNCSYKLIRIESTNQFESGMRQKGEETVIRIIKVENSEIFTYEIIVNNRGYTGQLQLIEKID